MKTKSLVFFGLVVGCIGFFACSKLKDETYTPLTEEQKIMKQQLSLMEGINGEIDLNSVQTAKRGNSKQFVISAQVKGNKNKKYVLYVDKMDKSVTKYSKFLFESDVPSTLINKNENYFNGFVQLTSLETDESSIRIEFANGIKTIKESKENNLNAINSSLSRHFDNKSLKYAASPLTDCIKRILRDMSLGEWVIFIATEPESMAGLILAWRV